MAEQMSTLRAHELADRFAPRHIGPDAAEQAAMLAELGLDSIDQLIDRAVPKSILSQEALRLPPALSERATIQRLREFADRNTVQTSLIGMGYYGTVTPPVILRNILENPAWYTAYTPYQPEISQGRLEALLNFQTVLMDLTGMDMANSSLLDEATAAAEAMTLARRMSRVKGDIFVVDPDCHPQTIEVVQTRAEPLGIEVVIAPVSTSEIPEGTFGVLLQYPASSGAIVDHSELATALTARGILLTVAADLLSLCLLEAPGTWGADIVIGSAQRFGVPMGFGGPHAGFMATRDAYKRSLPGRIVGMSVDTQDRPALRLALQTREQHIRREKATSNICTAQVLLAVIAGMYAVYHGPEGLTRIADRVHRSAAVVSAGLLAAGIEVVNDTFFDTVTFKVGGQAKELLAAANAAGFNVRYVDADTLAVSVDETTRRTDLDALLSALGAGGDVDLLDAGARSGIPGAHARTTDFLTADVFHQYRSETEMLRYLRRLSDRDIALDRSMIPLGSCTMKLNATTEMASITWPEFADIHPFAPLDQSAGYRELIGELEDWLAEATGYAAVSLQPNAGSQGEFAGLLAIRAYHRSRGDLERDICLIPSSAHGTNAASAVMAGMRVMVIPCDDQGNVDVPALAAKLEEVGPQVSALMVTYPSTHGVFEVAITDICEMIHAVGGQVYLDGANLNALVGVAQPGEFGSDVSHLNLHKTFCIPHGGGGPGVGPVAVREHLAPFLPGHSVVPSAGPDNAVVGAVSAAPWGSAGILPISWAYIAMMGADGLREATGTAILSANYLAKQLSPHFPVLYTGENGFVAHECIIDLRPLRDATGVTVDDVAKRLIDFGFHAPTMSFPVAGTLMIEPTESEAKTELDRFVTAMIAIKAEIDAVASGTWTSDDSPLRHAPHTAEDLLTDNWTRPYTREQAAFPVPTLRQDRYFPPVSRIDGVQGDRNLVCSCPPPEAFED